MLSIRRFPRWFCIQDASMSPDISIDEWNDLEKPEIVGEL